MPNPSKSDLVGEPIHAEAEWLKVEFGLDVDADTQESNASNLSDDEWLDLAAASPLAQQLEQAEQLKDQFFFDTERQRYREALERIADERPALEVGPLGKLYIERTSEIARAALTTPDSATEQEKTYGPGEIDEAYRRAESQ